MKITLKDVLPILSCKTVKLICGDKQTTFLPTQTLAEVLSVISVTSSVTLIDHVGLDSAILTLEAAPLSSRTRSTYKRAYHRLPPQVVAKIIEAADKGTSNSDIARDLGISKGSVWKVLHQNRLQQESETNDEPEN